MLAERNIGTFGQHLNAEPVRQQLGLMWMMEGLGRKLETSGPCTLVDVSDSED